ncbi:MAG TPA: heavy metal-associated domain-containing protein [Gemmatimonadales bacterium]|nr:heavy metal-associated domain-containing protein [Gemmatimonadales bacterium]
MRPTPAPTGTATLGVLGTTCTSCERRVRRALEAVPGVVSVGVNRADGLAIVAYDSAIATPAQLADAVSATGYAATAVSAERAPAPEARVSCGCCAA